MTRLPRIAPRGIALLLGLAAFAFVAAHGLPWAGVLAVVLLTFCTATAYDALALRGALEVEREAVERLALARPARLRYRVVNHGARTKVVALVEAPAARLAIDPREARAVVEAGARAVLEIPLVPRERGATALRSFHARIRSPLGIVELRRSWAAPAALRVAPDLSALDRSGDLAARVKLVEHGLRRLRRNGSGGTFAGLREYGRDDDFRRIDWKASARCGRPMVAQYEAERAQQIVVALDAGRLMAARLGDRRKLDYAVSAALAVAATARLAGDRVGAFAFAGSVLARVAPASDFAHAARVVDALGTLEPRFEEADYERALLGLAHTLRRRSLVVLFSDLFDPAASAAVLAGVRVLAARHLVLVVLMNDDALGAALRAEPAQARDAYRAAVAVTLEAERAHAVAALRAGGVLVVDRAAAELTLATLDAYVEIKTRARL